MRVETVNELAAKLGRPPTGLSGLTRLHPDQIALLDELITGARARRRQDLDRELGGTLPRPLGGILVALLRRGRR